MNVRPIDIAPLRDIIALEREELPDRVGRIHLPPSLKSKQLGENQAIFARVVAVGEGRKLPRTLIEEQREHFDGLQRRIHADKEGFRVTPQVRPGDRVVIGRWEGNEVERDGRKILFVFEEAIAGVVEEESTS
jgi:co-chaperonin GroES (HSP10)